MHSNSHPAPQPASEEAWLVASVKIALFSGILAAVLATVSFLYFPAIRHTGFVLYWGAYFVASGMLAWKLTSKALGDTLHSILKCMLPGIVTMLVFSGVVAVYGGQTGYIAFMWMIFYGLCLLSIQSYAPKQISWLAWMILAAGLIISVTSLSVFFDGNLVMGLVFGGFQLSYALLARPH